MIKIKGLNKSFKNNHVIKDMNFDFKEGVIFGLIGINGAGKSTLLRLLSNVLIPDDGQIVIDNENIEYNDKIRENIFYLSDEPPYANFTLLKDVKELYETFYNFDEVLYEEVLDVFQLDKSVPISKMSKGMRRQGFIALAFASRAKYLLFDEVFDGLDPQARLRFKQFIIKNHNPDQVIIITSHSLRELEDICDTFGMIDKGVFKKYGQIDTEIDKISKYQIVLKDIDKRVFKKQLDIIQQKQDGRVLTIIIDKKYNLKDYLDENNYLIIDELPMTFEEYFIVSQGGK